MARAKNNDTSANLAFEAKLWVAASAEGMSGGQFYTPSLVVRVLADRNLAIRAIDAQIAHGDTSHNDQRPDVKADYVLTNPPFNYSDWRGELLKDDQRWVYGTLPAGNGSFSL